MVEMSEVVGDGTQQFIIIRLIYVKQRGPVSEPLRQTTTCVKVSKPVWLFSGINPK